jgi:hypothetical protein
MLEQQARTVDPVADVLQIVLLHDQQHFLDYLALHRRNYTAVALFSPHVDTLVEICTLALRTEPD